MSGKTHELQDVCKGMKVLVVDDVPPNLVIIKAYFEVLGCEGDYAHNGLEAFEKIKANHYDICLMDFHMPVMDGLTATRKVRQELKSDMIIIALTGTATIEDLREGLNSGMNSYCTKPVSIQELAKAMLVYKK